jgi:AbiTii
MLIDDIIQLLSNEQGSLTEALLKTKLLLHQVQRKDLVSWVNHELTGYPEAADLPDYRILESRVKGDLMAPGWMANDQAIPIMHLEKDYREKLEKSEMRESLALVQELATKPQSSIRQPFPPEANRKLGSNLGNGWKIQSAWCEISVLSVQNILIQVRSRLLDFVLELKDSLGGATSESEIKEKSSSLDMTSMSTTPSLARTRRSSSETIISSASRAASFKAISTLWADSSSSSASTMQRFTSFTRSSATKNPPPTRTRKP